MENENQDSNMTYSSGTFDNLIILKEFTNIANNISNEDFLQLLPKTKSGRIYWISVLNCLKQHMLDEIVEEMNSMWTFENMNRKLEILEKQKEKFAEIYPANLVWRPQHTNIKEQLRALDASILKKEKDLFESLTIEYEVKVNKLKKTVQAKRDYLKAIQMDIQKYQRKNEEIISHITGLIQGHSELIEDMVPKCNYDIWSKKDDL